MKTINGFKGEYRWLSNFVGLDGQPTVEHRYQAAKAVRECDRNLILYCTTPGRAKNFAKTIAIRHDWNDIRLTIMEQLLIDKFTKEPFRTLLLATKGVYLEETNDWGDTFWGVCNGVGENNLGRLIMRIRDTYLSIYNEEVLEY